MSDLGNTSAHVSPARTQDLRMKNGTPQAVKRPLISFQKPRDSAWTEASSWMPLASGTGSPRTLAKQE